MRYREISGRIAETGHLVPMSLETTITEAVYAAFDEVNPQLPLENQLAKESSTILLGDGGVLDSLGVMNLIVAVEETLEERGLSVSLSEDEKLMESLGEENGPLRSVSNLVSFLVEGSQ